MPAQRKAQYKSAIWFHCAAQEAAARAAVVRLHLHSRSPCVCSHSRTPACATPLYRQAALETRHGVRIATDLAQAMPWTDAEEYHQDFYGKKRSWMNPQ